MGAVAPFIPLISSGVGALGGWLANRGKSGDSGGGTSAGKLGPYPYELPDWNLPTAVGNVPLPDYQYVSQLATGAGAPQDVADVGKWLELMVPGMEGLSNEARGRSGDLYSESALNLAKSRTALDPVLAQYLGLVSGDRSKMVEAAAPDLATLASQQKAAKEAVMLGPRGVAQDTALMQLPSMAAAGAAEALQKGRGAAFAALPGISQALASQGLTAAQLGGTELGRAIEALSQAAQIRQAGGNLKTAAGQLGLEQRSQDITQNMGQWQTLVAAIQKIRDQDIEQRGQDISGTLTARGQNIGQGRNIADWGLGQEQIAALRSAGNRGLLGSIIGGLGGPLLSWGLGKLGGGATGSRGGSSAAPIYDWGDAATWG